MGQPDAQEHRHHQGNARAPLLARPPSAADAAGHTLSFAEIVDELLAALEEGACTGAGAGTGQSRQPDGRMSPGSAR